MTSPEERFAQLHTRCGRDLLNFFRRRVAVDADSADLLAEAYLVLWRRIGVLPADDAAARCWAFGIARGVLANYNRGVRRRLALADRLRDELVTASASRTEPGANVDDLLEHLDPLDRDLLTLTHWDGLSLAEAAEVVGINASTARVRVHRARLALRDIRSGSPIAG